MVGTRSVQSGGFSGTHSVTKYSVRGSSLNGSQFSSSSTTSQNKRSAIWIVMCFGILLLSVGIVAFAVVNLVTQLESAAMYHWVAERRPLISDYIVYIHEMELERGRTASFLSVAASTNLINLLTNPGATDANITNDPGAIVAYNTALTSLMKARNATNIAGAGMPRFWSVLGGDFKGDELYEDAFAAYSNLTTFRALIDRGVITAEDSIAYYSYIVGKLQNLIMMIANRMSVATLKSTFGDLYRFSQVKDIACLIRATGNMEVQRNYSSDQCSGNVSDTRGVVNTFKTTESVYLDLATPSLRASYRSVIQSSANYKTTLDMISAMQPGGVCPVLSVWLATVNPLLDQYLVESQRILSQVTDTTDAEVAAEDQQVISTISILVAVVGVTAGIEGSIVMLMLRARRAAAKIKEQERTIRTRTRKVSLAPRSREVAMMFTDVQQSTKLWTALGSTMESAVALHHKVMRRAITDHGGYEVKTIGDAFMVAHEDPGALVQIAIDAQRGFLDADWPDEVYEEEDANIVYHPGGAQHGAIFRGLRVRMGIHYGPVEVMYDDVSKGYDYYGDTVNCSSRVEHSAIGGQVVVTGAVLERCRAMLEAQGCVIRELGPKELKGIAEPQVLYSVTPYGLEPRDEYFEDVIAKQQQSIMLKKGGILGSSSTTQQGYAVDDVRDVDEGVLLEVEVEGMTEETLRHVVRALRSIVHSHRSSHSDGTNNATIGSVNEDTPDKPYVARTVKIHCDV